MKILTMNGRLALAGLVLCLAVTACSGDANGPPARPTETPGTAAALSPATTSVPTPMPGPTPEPSAPTPTRAPSPTATLAPSPTATLAPTPEPTPVPTAAPRPTAAPTPPPAILTPAEVFSRISPSVVLIETGLSLGTGILIEGGYVLTNHHVVWPYDKAWVVFPDGTELEGVPVVNADPLSDLAVLGPVDSQSAPLALADGEDLPIGSELFLVGYPAEVELLPQPTITGGILLPPAGVGPGASHSSRLTRQSREVKAAELW